MNELLSRNARTVLLGDASQRQCTATSRDGTRCGRASALGQFVCDKHGAKAPLSQQAARERLLMLVEPALAALLRALQTGEPCAHCGRSDADRDPTVIRAATVVLDRSGFHPTLAVEQVAPPNPFDGADLDALEASALDMLASIRALRGDDVPALPAATDAELIEGLIDVDEGTAEDAPLHPDGVPFPTGKNKSDEGIGS